MQVLGPLTVLSCIIYLAFQRKDKRPAFLLIAVLFAVVAFSFQPLPTDDLTREYEKLRNIADKGWNYFSIMTANLKGKNYTNSFEGLYTAQLYYMIFSKFGVLNWFPAITIFIDYILEFKLLAKIQKRFELTERDGFILFLMIICCRETYNMMSGIRNYLAFTVFGYAIYEDIIERRNRFLCFLIYIACALMHPSAWILVAIRIVCFIPSRKVKNIVCVVSLLWGNLFNVILMLLGRFSGISLFNAVYVKMYSYINSESAYSSLSTASSRYLWYMASNLLIIVTVTAMFLSWKRYKNLNNNVVETCSFSRLNIKKGTLYIGKMPRFQYSADDGLVAYEDIFYFSMFCLTLMIGALPYRIIFSRIGIMVRVISIIPSAIMLDYYNRKDEWIKKHNIVILVFLACAFKFVIMMWFCNRSMHFNLLGLYY